MATDLTVELDKNCSPGSKSALSLESGFGTSGSGGPDRHQDRRSSNAVPPPSGTLNTNATSGRIPEYRASVFDIFKKIRRAERFGIPVHLSEAEKRFSRAERFGINTACGLDEMARAEELKRKARAERFELLSSSVASDEEAKKKARLARFTPFSCDFPSEN